MSAGFEVLANSHRSAGASPDGGETLQAFRFCAACLFGGLCNIRVVSPLRIAWDGSRWFTSFRRWSHVPFSSSHIAQMSSSTKRPTLKRRLMVQPLESRDMFAGIPQLSSLPSAPHTIYLDFDGHFQATWNRTDSNQTYTNVTTGEFNIDNMAGISTTEESAIRKIWETVADDYAPFNVNVTTVAPTSFANALRVVIAGESNATLRNSAGTTVNIPTRDVFISNDNGTMVDTSGYAAIGSYTNAEPNVVYVFAEYMSTWGTTDSEGRYRDLRSIIATTATHEAGHAFGLQHHGNYDVGTSLTTPIMGSNTQGDRSLWSLYTVGTTTFDTKARLTSLFGARPDEFTDNLSSATEFPIQYSPIRGYTGTVKGVIGTTSDRDLFRFTTTATNTYQITVAVPQFGNLDSQLVLYVVRGSGFGTEYLEQVIVFDPSIPSSSPFSGLGATMKGQLPAGKYALAVRSHGDYGDIGGYTLTVSIPSSQNYFYFDAAVNGVFDAGTTTQPTTPTPGKLSTSTLTIKSGGVGSNDRKSNAQLFAQESTGFKATGKKAEHESRDQVFEAWPTSLQRMRSASKVLKEA